MSPIKKTVSGQEDFFPCLKTDVERNVNELYWYKIEIYKCNTAVDSYAFILLEVCLLAKVFIKDIL